MYALLDQPDFDELSANVLNILSTYERDNPDYWFPDNKVVCFMGLKEFKTYEDWRRVGRLFGFKESEKYLIAGLEIVKVYELEHLSIGERQ